jgi:hypothetical protein
MSNDVTNFAASLVEMAKAMERVPTLEMEINFANDRINGKDLQITDLQVSLEASRRYAASLEQRCHDLEVSRDAAELRFLEADDVVSTIKSVLRRTMEDADSALKAIEPVVEPTPVAEPVSVSTDPTIHSNPDQSSLGDQISQSTNQSGEFIGETITPSPFPDTTPSTVQSAEDGMGKSEVGPTVSTTITEPQNASLAGAESADSAPVTSEAPSPVPFASTTTPPNPAHLSLVTTSDVGSSQTEAADAKPIGPYFGRNYMSVPGFISRLDWLAGGGTNEGYDWRP